MVEQQTNLGITHHHLPHLPLHGHLLRPLVDGARYSPSPMLFRIPNHQGESSFRIRMRSVFHLILRTAGAVTMSSSGQHHSTDTNDLVLRNRIGLMVRMV